MTPGCGAGDRLPSLVSWGLPGIAASLPASAHWGPVDPSPTTCEFPEGRACLLHHLPPLPVSSAELTPRVQPGWEEAHLQGCATQLPLSAHVQQQVQGCLRGHGCRLRSPWVGWNLNLRKGWKTGTQAPSPPASGPDQHEPCPCCHSSAELTWLINDGGATQGVRTEQWGSQGTGKVQPLRGSAG